MGIKCEEEFNPWPSFVDIFSSVILVLLLFLLITIVNIGYYAQFKHKVSYTGSVSSDELILSEKPEENKQEETRDIPRKIIDPVPVPSNPKKIIEELKKQIVILQKKVLTSQTKFIAKTEVEDANDTGEIEATGYDITSDKVDEKSKQKIIESEDYYIISFAKDEVFVETSIRKKLKEFIKKAKKRYPNHKVYILAVDRKNPVSATVAKQVSLGRTLAIRNFIRKLRYDKKDVRVDLVGKVKIDQEVDYENGYLVIKIKKK